MSAAAGGQPDGRALVYGTLVFAATAPASFYLFGLPLVLRDKGVSLAAIGIVQIPLLLPGFRLLWAPLFDRVRPHPRSPLRAWTIITLVVMAASTVAIGWQDLIDEPGLLALLAVLPSLAFASFDTLSNSLVASGVEESRRSVYNGANYAGFLLSTVLGGGLLVITYDTLGWSPTWMLLAAIAAAGIIPVLFLREGPVAELPATRRWIRTFLRRPRAMRWLAVMLVYNSGVNAGVVLMPELLIDEGWTLQHVGMTLGISGPLAAAVGAAGAGLWLRRSTTRAAIGSFGVIQTVACIAAAFVATTGAIGPQLAAGVGLQIANALTIVVLLTVAQHWARRPSLATDLSLQLSFFLVGNMAGVVVAQFLAGAFGFAATFWVCAVSAALGTAFALASRAGDDIGSAAGASAAGALDRDGSASVPAGAGGDALAAPAPVPQPLQTP